MVLLLLMRLLARRGETKKKCLVFKVDYEKVYDLLCWDFLLYMMKLKLKKEIRDDDDDEVGVVVAYREGIP